MISERTYSKDWIESFRRKKEYSKINPPLLEKMIYAFSLLEMLSGSGLDFIFKGGTSLLLMPVDSHRFSVDIDIITKKTKEELEQYIEKSIETSVFTSYIEDTGRVNKGGVPKAHYIFKFNAVYNMDGNILLDVLFEKNPYVTLVKTEIKCDYIETTEPAFEVTIPSVNSILGDKLTAFAPNTTGVPYWMQLPDRPDKRIEIIKQLYDVSNLISHCTDIVETKQVFEKIANHQIQYRNLMIGANDVIDDIFNTALVLAKRDKNIQEPEKTCFFELQTGIKMFENYLIKSKFRIEQAIDASAKVAYFSQFMKDKPEFDFELFSPDSDVFSKEITGTEYNFLNRLKKTNKQAFFYWYKYFEVSGI